MRKLVAVAVLSLSLAACQQPGTGAGPGEIGLNKTTGGALAGAGVGGLVGSQFGGGAGKGALTALGVLAGAFAGSQVGKSLDSADVVYAQRTQQQAFETGRSGQPVAWRNPDTGASGTVIPRPAVQQSSGAYCREFQQNITVGGRTEEAYGTACRQPDGSWKVVN
jgi:surface antigen